MKTPPVFAIFFGDRTARVAEEQGIAVDDLYAFILPLLAMAQNPDDVHFSPQGYELLGGRVAGSLNDALGR